MTADIPISSPSSALALSSSLRRTIREQFDDQPSPDSDHDESEVLRGAFELQSTRRKVEDRADWEDRVV